MQRAEYPDVPPDFGHWLAGFIDGEGCFYIRIGYRRGTILQGSCRFNIVARADERPILEEIQRRVGVGHIYHTGASVQKLSGYRINPKLTFVIQSKAECQRLVELLDRYPLRAKKARDYCIWREAVLWWCRPWNPHRCGARDWTPLTEMRDRLRDGRRFVDTA